MKGKRTYAEPVTSSSGFFNRPASEPLPPDPRLRSSNWCSGVWCQPLLSGGWEGGGGGVTGCGPTPPLARLCQWRKAVKWRKGKQGALQFFAFPFALRCGQNGSVVYLSSVRMPLLNWAGDIISEGGNSFNAVEENERKGRRKRRKNRGSKGSALRPGPCPKLKIYIYKIAYWPGLTSVIHLFGHLNVLEHV